MLACGALALVVAGGLGLPLAAAFAALLVGTWKLEGSKWQLPDRAGLAVVLLSLPLFYLDWKFQTGGAERAGINLGALTHFVLFLSAIKLWQKKADRDWLFLYLISFFEVLLAAGLSVSPHFLASLCLFMFCALSTVVAFEIRRARRNVPAQETRFVRAPRAGLLGSARGRGGRRIDVRGEARRLAVVAFCLLVLIFTLALPIFFITPRSGASALSRADGGLTGLVGFSDEVKIGELGRLNRSNQVVMHVRVDTPQTAQPHALRWRGVALDEFDGRAWRRTVDKNDYLAGGERGLFRFDTTEALERLTTQTFFVEPMDTPILFIAPRAIAVQGALPYVRRDAEGGLATRLHPQERITYRAYSDTNDPPLALLQLDNGQVPRAARRYLQLPDNLDPRVFQLARQWVVGARAGTNYDAARTIEWHLSHDFTYSLDRTAGGADPLADFLFRVRAGHCEYFSTAMAVMMRTLDVPARVVNGFQQGEYNEAADAYTVRQADAHSWVEVYFPQNDAWVSFDPTPEQGRPGGTQAAGWLGPFRKYAEALELFWIQYVVAYDKQEQRSLASSVRSSLGIYRQTAGQIADDLRARLQAWWRQVSASGAAQRPPFVGNAPLLLLVFTAAGLCLIAARRLRRLLLGGKRAPAANGGRSAVAFYERMNTALAARGLRRASDQTPLEFATATGLSEALLVTRAYNRVRFGPHDLSPAEAARVETWLQNLEGNGNAVTS